MTPAEKAIIDAKRDGFGDAANLMQGYCGTRYFTQSQIAQAAAEKYPYPKVKRRREVKSNEYFYKVNEEGTGIEYRSKVSDFWWLANHGADVRNALAHYTLLADLLDNPDEEVDQ